MTRIEGYRMNLFDHSHDLLFGEGNGDLKEYFFSSGLQTAQRQIKNRVFRRSFMGCIFTYSLFLLVCLPIFSLSAGLSSYLSISLAFKKASY